MAQQEKKKKQQQQQKEYQTLASQYEPKRPIMGNMMRAFVAGGAICVFGQAITDALVHWFEFSKKDAANPTVAILIIISVLLTSFGVYDRFAQWAGAGSAVPVTGFANAMSSAAIEHRAEGVVLGIGANMFKLAGSVIVFGTVAAFVVGIVHAILNGGGGH
jgi:stage V sporulation protein AC